MSADRPVRILIGTIVACGLTLAATAGALAVPALRSRLGWPPVPVPTYARGERIDVPVGLYQSRPFTLVVFARYDCVACQTAKPALAAIAADLRSLPGVETQVVMGLGQPEAEKRFVAELGLDDLHLQPLDTKSLKIRTVPALALVNREGRVLYREMALRTTTIGGRSSRL